MNWLAHALLSEDVIDCRLGNLLADALKKSSWDGLNVAFRRGIQLHRAIDSFTDAHPAVHRSKARLQLAMPHTSGIVIDIYYDHLLATNWNEFGIGEFDPFIDQFNDGLRGILLPLPVEARFMVERILAEDRLRSYRTIAGIEQALERLSLRISERLKREVRLQEALVPIQEHQELLLEDFRTFFPELVRFVEAKLNLFSNDLQ